jgi:ribosomal protein S27AE
VPAVIPVVRAETFYLPAPPESPDAWAMVPPALLVWRWYEARMGRRVIPPDDDSVTGESYYARINQNRWLADCSSCGSAAVVSPADPRYACTQCGWGWCALTFPADVAAVEASLIGLKPALRNWWNDADPSNPNPPPGDPIPSPPDPQKVT